MIYRDLITDIINDSLLKKYPNLSEEEYIEKFKEIFESNQEKISNLVLKYFTDDKKKSISKIVRQRIGFEKRLLKRWSLPLNNLDYFIHRCITEGKDYIKKISESADRDNDYKHIAMSRLHGQACLISNEVLTLLRSGYAEGANARWRSLFELSVINSILLKNENDISRLFLEYYHIQNFNEYQLFFNTIANPSENERNYFDRLYEKKEDLIRKYGIEFSKKYGWLSSIISKQKDRNFLELQKCAELEEMNHLYSFSSINVHVGPDSLFTKISMYNGRENSIILAGPSNYGLAEPGAKTVKSLSFITLQFLLSKPSLDMTILTRSLELMAENIQSQFNICQKKLEQDEESLK